MPEGRYQSEPLLQVEQGILRSWETASGREHKRQVVGKEVKEMRHENEQMKLLIAELSLKNRIEKNSLLGLGDETWND